MSHRKSQFRLLVVLVVVAMLFAACNRGRSGGGAAGAAESPSYVVKMGHIYSLEDNLHRAALMLSDLVSQRTNGKVTIEVYGGGQLGGTVALMESVADGVIPAAAEAINGMEALVPLAGIESYPFLFDNAEQLFKFLNSDLSKELWKDIGGNRYVLTGAQYRGVRMLQTIVPVRKLADLKGLKIRTANAKALHLPWVILGAAATPMDFTEAYMAMQQGAVDGQENPLFTSYASGFHEIEKYVMNTEHVYGIVTFVWNKAYFDGLPQEYQNIIRQASDEVVEWRNKIEANAQGDYIKLFLDAGCEYIELPDLDEWKRVLEEPLRQEFPHMQAWVDRIKEFNRANS